MERAAGIEPACLTWKDSALPLSYARADVNYETHHFPIKQAFFTILWNFPKVFQKIPLPPNSSISGVSTGNPTSLLERLRSTDPNFVIFDGLANFFGHQ